MTPSARLAVKIDKKVLRILEKEGDEGLLAAMDNLTCDLKKIMGLLPLEKIKMYCSEFKGFFYAITLLNDVCAGIPKDSLCTAIIRKIEKTKKEPNKKTRKVLDDCEKGIGLHKCKDINDFYKQLGI